MSGRIASLDRSLSSRTPSSPRRPKPPPTYAVPATRDDAIHTALALQAARSAGRSHAADDAAFDAAFHETVRQVYVHCAERGELLEAIRSQLANRETILRARLASQADELERLRRESALLHNTAAAGASATERLSLLSRASEGLPAAARAELVGRLVAEPAGERAAVLERLISETAADERSALLASALGALPRAECVRLIGRVGGGLGADALHSVVRVCGGQLPAELRADAAGDLAAGAPSGKRADLARRLVGALPKLEQGPAARAVLGTVPKDERVNALADDLRGLRPSETTQLIAGHAAELSSEARVELLGDVLSTAATPEERRRLAEEEVYGLPSAERQAMLAEIIGTLVEDDRRELLIMLEGGDEHT